MVMDSLVLIRRVSPVVLLALFWCWETWRPFFRHEGRGRHALRNLALALCNTVVLGFAFGSMTAFVAAWTAETESGLLHLLGIDEIARFALALVLLDGWMYLWHRANHGIPFLWRFHRMHHSDTQMDVTTATRFHIGELMIGAGLRLGLIPLLGLSIWHIVAYDTLVVAVTQFHHADIALGRLDRYLRFVIVTPDMHKIHHSDLQPETDSNYSSVLSCWDRLAGSFRMRQDLKQIRFGLRDFRVRTWQTVWGMLRTPWQPAHPNA